MRCLVPRLKMYRLLSQDPIVFSSIIVYGPIASSNEVTIFSEGVITTFIRNTINSYITSSLEYNIITKELR